MARVSPIQESFAYGEIDARLRGRVSIDAYRGGLKRARNWYPLVQGPIRLREGSKFMEQCDGRNHQSGDTSTSGFRVFTFSQGLDNDIVFEVGVDPMAGTSFLVGRDSNTGIQVIAGQSENLVPDAQYAAATPGAFFTFDNAKYPFGAPSTVGQFAGVSQPGTADALAQFGAEIEDAPDGYSGPALESASGDGAIIIPAGSELLVNTLTINVWSYIDDVVAILLGGPPFTDFAYRIKVGTTPGAFDIVDDTDPWSTLYFTETIVKNFIPGATNNTLYLSIGIEWVGGAIPDLQGFFSFASAFLSPMDYRVPLAGGGGGNLEFASPWTSDQLECLQYAMDPGEQFAVFTHPNVEPHVLRFITPNWTFLPISSEPGFVAPTGSVWSAQDYPAACAFHEGRLVFGGSPSFPNALWFSRSGDYVDLDAAAPAAKDDPLLFTLSSAGTVQTLTSRKELVVNTDISEVIGTSQDGIIAFDDFSFPKQTDWGANCVQPMVIGRDMVYTSESRRKVRTFADEGGTNFGWDGNELSLLATDIFKQPVRRMVYLDEPGYQACFLLADGTMGMCTYYYPEDAIGWWRYNTAYNGQTPNDPGLGNQQENVAQDTNTIMDITRINTSQGAKLWMVVNRSGYSGSLNLGHELLGFDTGIKAALDNYAVRQPYDVFADGNLRVDDVDELSDQSCTVIVLRVDPTTGVESWTTHPNVTVIAGVSSPLEAWVLAGTVYIGLKYENDFQLLSLEGVSNRGTSQSSKRRWNKVYARLNDSPVPLIEGIYAKDRTPSTPMGTGEPFVTGDTEIVDLGSGEGDLRVTQDRALITEVTGIFGKVGASEI